MRKGRLEAFSDGVIAIIITIMVLEFRLPHGDQFRDLTPMIPAAMSYVLSFVYVGIYWNNHHHIFQAVDRIDGTVLWANQFQLFCLSIIPFVTNWMGETRFSHIPVFLYGVVMLMNSVAFSILVNRLLKVKEGNRLLEQAIGSDRKGKISTVLYILALPLAFLYPRISLGIYLVVALIWFLPDSRIEKVVHGGEGEHA